ncbi:MAG: cupredoxin domain-containing protein [Chloroflexota bacterium]
MTDLPGSRPEERLPATRPAAEPVPADRFSAPPSARAFGLTPERAAKIVRQSASARGVGFLVVVVVVVFVALYYLYELGFPGPLQGLPFVPPESRLAADAAAQQVTAVERGYNIYQANCARCHGPKGEGGIGPVLNDQSKLYQHLNPNYLRNVLTVGGRYVCGNPDSLMPVWSDAGNPPGPLNYVQINDLIAFLRATNDREYVVRDPSLGEPVIDPKTGKEETFTGWRDPKYQPAPDATPVPACWSAGLTAGGGAAASPAPAGSPAPAASGAPAATTLQVTAQNIQFDKSELEAPAGQPFAIEFNNQDAGVPHNVAIKDANGQEVFKGEIFNGVATRTYQVPALPAGTYTFYCTVHPNMTGTLTIK